MMKQMKMLLLILLLAVTNSVNAQTARQFSVASFELDQFDLTAQNERYKKIDGNGSLFAIIKVTTNNPDDDLSEYRFNFGILNHEVVTKDGELWVYVQRNAKMVTISRKGFTTISKYDLGTTIEAGRCYLMQLSATAAPVYTQMVQFSIMPASTNAVVMVKSSKANANEELFGNTDKTGSVAKSLPLGSYTYRVMAENYFSSEGRFTLNDRTKNHIEKVVLRPNFSEMTLQVNADADIYVNGEMKGRRMWTGVLKAGSYQVECRQANHRNSSQFITVNENDNRTIILTPPAPITGTLAVTSRPLGANIQIDGKNYGTTPQNINDLIIGSHTVTLSLSNYKSESQTVEIKKDQTTHLDVTMNDLAKMTIDSRPTNSLLYIDGKFMGTTPYTAEMVSGDYSIKITHHKYHDFNKKVHLDSSNPHATLSLDRQYQNPNAFYIQADLQVGSLMAAGITLGGYISNFNIEGGIKYGLSKSETVYWNYTGESSTTPVESSYTPLVYGGRLGYGIIAGTRWRFTPQVGFQIVTLSGNDDHGTSAYVATGSVGGRADMAVTSSFGLFVAPEITFALSKSNTYQQLEALSSKIKGWGSGFNVRLGMSLTF